MGDSIEEQPAGRDRPAQLDLASRREADVVVVGAGLAGLAAARALLRSGLRPVVLEARDRIGGRVVNEPIGDGQVVEMGGQWSPPRNVRLRDLAAETSLRFFATHSDGASLLELGGAPRRQKGKIPPLRPRALLAVGLARALFDRLARSVPAREPWNAPRARELDTRTLADWLSRAVWSRDGRALLDVAATTIWGAAPDQINLLQALAYASSAGGFEALTTSEVQDRIVGGSARLAEVLAVELGDRVACGHPVDRITDHGSSVEVEAGGSVVTARRVIVAIPPQLAAGLTVEPALPTIRARALRSLPMAAVTKVAAVYERPFWREQGLSGQAITTRGMVTAMFDNSPPEGHPGVLIGFVPGERAGRFAGLASSERRDAVLKTFVRMYGREAAKPRLFLEKDWSADPWTQGCYFGLARAGALTGVLRLLSEPIGSLHWAGAETAVENYGGMDGALASGERAAAEVIAALPARVVRT